MEECMKKKLGLVGLVASAALVGSTLLVPSASAAPRTIIVWADDVRGPQLATLIGGNTSIVPGYKIQVKFFSSLTALQDAWSKASAASAPDVLTGPAGFVLDAKSGKLAAIQPGSKNSAFSKGAISAMSYGGKQYGVALDIDTTAFVYNKSLFGSTAPTSLVQMVNFYNANKESKSLVGGVCAVDGTWDHKQSSMVLVEELGIFPRVALTTPKSFLTRLLILQTPRNICLTHQASQLASSNGMVATQHSPQERFLSQLLAHGTTAGTQRLV
jgi:maltose-binding protein MalE